MNRKLIRPKLAELKSRAGTRSNEASAFSSSTVSRRKQIPPEQTNAENFYYLKQMSSKTPMIIVMHDGEQLKGVIEWYDRDCIKVNRYHEPNLVVMKRFVRYMFKDREKRG